MARLYQVPHHAFMWLLLAVLMATLPHLMRAPGWMMVVVPVLLCWRFLVQRGRLRMPGKIIRATLMVVAVLATLYSYGTLLGPEAGVALLVVAFALKTLEMFRLRDAYVVIILACFVLATTFLFNRDPLTTVYVGVVLVLVMAALVGINHAQSGASSWGHLRLGGALVLQALPLMMVLFVLVPRFPPLWNMQLNPERARTGMSDSMAPGEISNLSRSAEPAFRVEFEGEVPPPALRYWRGLTYSWFDGRRWSQAAPQHTARLEYVRFPDEATPPWYASLLSARGEPEWRYRVIMERTGRQWLYALSVPFTDKSGVGVARDKRLVSRFEIDSTFDYRVESYRFPVAVEGLEEWERQLNVSLPSSGNLRTRRLAEQWHQEAGSDRAFIDRLLRWFNEEPFFYTLEPPLLAEDTVDDFIFRSRRGFCEHYSSAFAFMLRAAGIPARIVAGYQGGELNRLGNHLMVRQYDAHVWVEAWLPAQGWVEFDPTAAVAPSRVEFGLDQALSDFGEQAGGFGANLRRNPLFSRLSHMTDYMDFVWSKWVLGYNQDSQFEVLSRLLGQVNPQRIAVALVLAGGGVVLLVLGWVLWRSRTPGLSWWQKEHGRMLRLLNNRGVPLTQGTSPQGMVDAVAVSYPSAARLLQDWQRCYEHMAYRRPGQDPELLRRQLVLLRRKAAVAMRGAPRLMDKEA